MTELMTGPDAPPRAEEHAEPLPGAVTDPDSPWHGIPAELLDGTHSYDTDSAGGCG
jgi:hypothetical protein